MLAMNSKTPLGVIVEDHREHARSYRDINDLNGSAFLFSMFPKLE